MTIQLNKKETEELMTPVKGSGGFQGLFRYLQAKLKESGELTITKEDANKIERAMSEHGSGGYQSRLRKIFSRTLAAHLSS